MPAFLLTLVILSRFALGAAQPESVVTLPAIVKAGSAADILQDDPILPVHQSQSRLGSSEGSVAGDLKKDVAVPISDTGSAGGVAQIRALGRSAEDVDVQTLGIPLNPPQGGGFDLSTFPEYFWSGYRFQMGPSLSGFDPRGVSGTLNLVPWTSAALDHESSQLQLRQFVSGAGIVQSSIATRAGADTAVLLGYSSGDAKGPAGSLSGRWNLGAVRGKFHFLGTRLDTTPGPRNKPTQASQVTTRLVPVLQAEMEPADGVLIKSSAFYDNGYIRFDDPSSFASRDRFQQLGLENALLVNAWKFGLSARQVSFSKIGFDAPTERILNLQGSRAFEAGGAVIEPTVQATGVERTGMRPGASLGARQEFGKNAVFARASFSERFPSLTDRYYTLPGAFEGNPEVGPEKTCTLQAGTELKLTEHLRVTLQGYGQLRQDLLGSALNSSGIATIQNSGIGRVGALLNELTWQPLGWLEFQNSTTFTQTYSGSGDMIPFIPTWSEVFRASTRPVQFVRFDIITRAETFRFTGPFFSPLPGYAIWDVRAGFELPKDFLSNFAMEAGVENLFDRGYELFPGYPQPGRAAFLGLVGTL